MIKIWYNNVLDQTRFVKEMPGNKVRVGRHPGNDLVLNSPFIAEQALTLFRNGSQWELVVHGLNGCLVGDKEVRGGDSKSIFSGDTIKIFPYSLTVDLPGHKTVTQAGQLRLRDQEMSELIAAIHLQLLKQMDLSTDQPDRSQSTEYLLVLEKSLEEIAALQGLLKPPREKLVKHIAGHAVRTETLGGLMANLGRGQVSVWQEDGSWSRLVSQVPEREEELKKTVAFISHHLKLKETTELTRQIFLVEQNFWDVWTVQVDQIHEAFLQYLAQRYLKKEIKDIVFGYGPLEDLLRSPTVSEIMVVDRDHIYIEKTGVLENSGRRFISDDVTQSIIERIVSKVGRRIDKSQPLVDARLTDGSRVNAIIPPLAIAGPCLTIRKFPSRKMLVDDLIAKGSMTETVAQFLQAAVLAHCNILISGGTGTGKTTLLNCLSDFIPDKERIITIEDTAELQIKKEHVVRLETKSANIEGAGAYTIRDLVKNALRMRPDRIIVGECRGAEALDMLQAMNTGHDGSMTTIHANTSEDVILRLEVLVQMAAALPVSSIHRQIASALDLIIQIRRMRDGTRRVVQVTEVVGLDPEGNGLLMKELFALEDLGDREELRPTGCMPTFMGELIQRGYLKLETFYRDGPPRK